MKQSAARSAAFPSSAQPVTETARPAVVLLSGGVDSTTTLAVAARQGFELNALTFRYGQRHEIEVEAARRVARTFRVARHEIVTLDLRRFRGSDRAAPRKAYAAASAGRRHALQLRSAAGVEEDHDQRECFGTARAETRGAAGAPVLLFGLPGNPVSSFVTFELFVRPALRFLEGRQQLRIHTPLISLAKKEIIETGLSLGVDYGLTASCYDPFPTGEACGRCDSCQIRLRGFAAAGVPDPVRYREPAGAAG